jgi:EmrB/QacA subfamily drug resistance transporter
MDTTTSRTHAGVILALTCAAQFMVVLDIAIVNVALPSVQQDLDVSESTLQWVVIAYGLMLGGFLLLGGRMADLLGRRRILVTGMTIFSAASLVSGIAQSATVLITARGFQGFGAALVAPAALSILAVTFSEGQQRNRALGIFGAIGGGAASVGVIASGLLTDGPGWRWVFFINIPLGIALITLAMAFLAPDRGERGTRNFDVAGATTVTGGLLLLVYGLNRGAEDGWTTTTTLLLFGAAALLLASFVRIEARSHAPLVPAAVVRHRTLVAANLSAFFAFSAFFSFIFLGSLLMQQILGYSPTKTGVAWLATSITAFAGSAVAGARLVATVGVRRLIVTGLTLLAIGMLWLARVPADASFVTDLLPAFLLAGVAIGLCAPSAQIGALSGVSESTSGLASGLVETMREIGGAAGVAAVSTALVSRAGIEGFRAGFVVICVTAALGAVTAGVVFQRRSDPLKRDASLPQVTGEDALVLVSLLAEARNRWNQTHRQENGMDIADKEILVTGANRGIGQALVDEALRRGAKRVYAGTRQPLAHADVRVTPLTLDVTNAAQIRAAVESVESLDVLINNAGVALYDDLSDRAVLEHHLDVNLFGTYGVTQAFLPLLTRSGGAIVNNVSVLAFAPLPLTPAYAISKAAAFNLTQSLRALLAGRGVRVHAALTGPVDTDMTRDFDIPKASPESVARAIFDGVVSGEDDIFPDPMSASMAESWRNGAAKALERQNAGFVDAQSVTSNARA